jgi:hypothetical protein
MKYPVITCSDEKPVRYGSMIIASVRPQFQMAGTEDRRG